MMGSLASLCLGAGTESWAVGGYCCAEIMLGGAWGMYLDGQGDSSSQPEKRGNQ